MGPSLLGRLAVVIAAGPFFGLVPFAARAQSAALTGFTGVVACGATISVQRLAAAEYFLRVSSPESCAGAK